MGIEMCLLSPGRVRLDVTIDLGLKGGQCSCERLSRDAEAGSRLNFNVNGVLLILSCPSCAEREMKRAARRLKAAVPWHSSLNKVL